MREFKFRGKSLSNGEWVHGNLVTKVDVNGNVIQALINNRISSVHYEREYPEANLIVCQPVNFGTVVQYTGIKDKNGKEIYEGDILSTDLSRPCLVVEFKNGAFMYQCHDNGKNYYDFMLPADSVTSQDKHLEVIGNIYDNPELLGAIV